MIQRLQLFLGPARLRLFILLLGGTGLISLILNSIVDVYDWVRPAQSLLVLVFLVGAALIFGGRMERAERLRWALVLAPAVGALALAFFLPDLSLVFVGAAFGWVVAALFSLRSRARIEYQRAIKLLRKEQYAEAVKIMDALIQQEADDPNHYRFRAEILRLSGKLGQARRDYHKMIEIAPEMAVGYNGLAEVCLQAGDYAEAREAALGAYQRAPQEWVAPYNLGMIEDRLNMPEAAVEHLQAALALRVPDARHRLLIYLYLIRAYSRLGDAAGAQDSLHALKQHKHGLEEWQSILANSMAATLREVLAADVETAQALIDGKLDVIQLAGRKS